MQLYYRADTRNPKTIFETGFTPRDSFVQAGHHWWKFGIRQVHNEYSYSPKTNATDAEMRNVVCLSKKFESAPIFPVCDQYHTDYESEVYIYVMALPDAELPADFNTPQDIHVFDMQAYQSREVQDIINNPRLSINPAMSGYVLSGHEAFTRKVDVEHIICAVKCKRSDFAITAGLPVFSMAKDDAANFVYCQTRSFEIGHEIFLNKNYSGHEDYKNDAINELREVKAKGMQPTTNVQDALDYNGIQYDKKQINTSTYFWQELTSLHFGMVFFSILESIYYAAIQLCKQMINKPEQKSVEIIETLPDSMQDSHKRKPLSFYGRYFTTVGVITGEATPLDAYFINKAS